MRILSASAKGRSRVSRTPGHESGSAVLLVLAILSILLIFFSVEFATLRSFRRESKLINQRQIRRLERSRPKAKPARPPAESGELNKVSP